MYNLFTGIVRALGVLALAATTAAVAQTATLTANQTSYDTAGGTVTLSSTLSYTATPTAYAFSAQLPAGWKFVSQSLGGGLSAAASPAADDNLLEWAFSGFPASQLSWSFVVSYPAGLSGDQAISVVAAQYRTPTTNLAVPTVTLTRAVPTAPSISSQPQSQTVTVGDNVTFSVSASGTGALSYQWKKNGAAVGGATNSSFNIGSAQNGDAGNYTVDVSNSVGTATSNVASLTVNAPSPIPRVTSQPSSQTVNAGSSVTLSVGASGAAPLSYQWRKNGTDIAGATSSTYTIASPQSRDAGTYSVRVSNASGSATSNDVSLTVNSSGLAANLVNIATRAYCSTGNGVAIGGFVIGGNTSKQVLVRAVGPTLVSLGMGANEVLLDPRLELHKGAPTIATNDNWSDNANAALITSTAARIGASPLAASDTKSAALLTTLQPGAYTFIVSGANNSSGIVLLEVYDAD